MFLIQQFLPGILAAALLSGAILVISGWLGRGRRWCAAIAIGVGYASGHAVLAGWPSLPPHSASQWPAWFALASMLLGVLDGLWRSRSNLRFVLWPFLYAGFGYLLALPRLQYEWTGAEGLLWIVGFALGVSLLSWSFEALACRQPMAFSLPLTLTILAAGTSASLLLSGSMLLGQMASLLSAPTGVLLVLTAVLPRIAPEGRSAISVAAPLFASLWLSGYLYAELPATSALLLLLAPLLSLITFACRLAGWKATLLQTSVVTTAVLAAILKAWHASPPFPY